MREAMQLLLQALIDLEATLVIAAAATSEPTPAQPPQLGEAWSFLATVSPRGGDVADTWASNAVIRTTTSI